MTDSAYPLHARRRLPGIAIAVLLCSWGAAAQTLTISPNPAASGQTVTLQVLCPSLQTNSIGLYQVEGAQQLAIGYVKAAGIVNFVGTFNVGITEFQGFCLDTFANVIGLTPVESLTVQTSSTVSISSSANPAIFGHPFSITVTVPGVDTGDVTLFQDSRAIATTPLGPNGTVVFPNLLYNKTDVYHFSANYGGNGVDLPASSPTITVNVISHPANGFETPSTTQLQMAPGQSAIADFNHDGIPDVAVLGGSAGLAILIGNGDGTFKAPAYYPTPGHNASMLVAGDFNGDGYSDVALVEGGSQNFQVANLIPMMNNGDGTFTFNSGTIVLLPLTAAGIAAGDYNGDGKTDLCVIDRNDSIASFFKGSSAGLVLDGRLQIDPAGKGLLPSAVAFGDFDGDGKLDLALAGRSLDGVGVTSILRFLHGDGAGHFGAFANEADQTIDGGWGVPYAIGTGDLNGDRVDDVIVSWVTSDSFVRPPQGIDIFYSDGPTTQKHSHLVEWVPPSAAGVVSVIDVDGDGNNDMVFSLSGSVGIMFGVPGDSFKPLTQLPVSGGGPNSVNIGDLNKDGFVDLIYTTSTAFVAELGGILTSSASTTTISTSATPSLSGHAITLTAAIVPPANHGLVAFYEGENIIARVPVSQGFASFETSLLPMGLLTLKARFLGDNSFSSQVAPSISAPITEIITSLASAGFLPPVQYAAGESPDSVVMADFNGDGILDMAVANFGDFSTPGTVCILLGNGNGTFQAAKNYNAGFLPLGIVAADFNADGHPDLVVANLLFLDGFSVLINNGDGTFQAPAALPSNSSNDQTIGIAVGDFNGDGVPDVAVDNANSLGEGFLSYASIFTSNRNGTFTRVNQANSAVGLFGSVAFDFNGDGKDDLVSLIQFNGYGVASAVNPPSGPFTAVADLQADISPGTTAIVKADINRDGVMDVVITSNEGVEVFLGTGGGNFLTGRIYPVGGVANQIVIADLDGDGFLDIAVAGTIANQLLVLRGNGDGSFKPYVSYALPVVSTAIAAADLNGDGRVDIVATGPNGVSIFYGQPPAPAPDLTTSSSHSGNPSVLQPATFTITVTNIGNAPSSGAISVTEVLPIGMTGTAISGNGWSCDLPTLKCTTSAVIAPNGSMVFTVQASVNANQASTGTSEPIVSGGGDTNIPNNYGFDTTTIVADPTVQILVPAGVAFNLDGTPYVGPQSILELPGSEHQMTTAGTQSGLAGTQFVFQKWIDVVPYLGTNYYFNAPNSGSRTITGVYATQYLLTAQSSPSLGGSVSVGTGYLNAGSTISIAASANPGYVFAGFSGALSGQTTPQQLVLNAPANVVANFAPLAPQLTVSVGTRSDGPDGTRLVTITANNSGRGAATTTTITAISATVVTGSGTVAASGLPIILGTIAPGAQSSTQVTFTWPATASRVTLKVSYTADGGISGIATSTVFR